MKLRLWPWVWIVAGVAYCTIETLTVRGLGSRENGGQNSQGAGNMTQKKSMEQGAEESNLGSIEHRI